MDESQQASRGGFDFIWDLERQKVFHHVGKAGNSVTDTFQNRLVSAMNMWSASPGFAFWHRSMKLCSY
jgi:hypothetical protein